MTKPEITNHRDLYFSRWVRSNLPDSQTGFCAADFDFIFWNWKTKKLMLIEVKTRNSNIAPWFKRLITGIFDRALREDAERHKDYEYRGAYVITFENTSFDDGLVFWAPFSEPDNKREISELILREALSMMHKQKVRY